MNKNYSRIIPNEKKRINLCLRIDPELRRELKAHSTNMSGTVCNAIRFYLNHQSDKHKCEYVKPNPIYERRKRK